MTWQTLQIVERGQGVTILCMLPNLTAPHTSDS